MDKIKEFKDFYDNSLSSALDKVEKRRKSVIFQIVLLFAVFLVALPLAMVKLLSQLDDTSYLLYFTPLVLLLMLLVYVAFNSLKRSTKYYNAFKYLVINKIIHYINPNLNYDNKYHVAKSEYLNCYMFKKESVAIEGDDHVSGKADDIKIEFSELEAKFRKKNKREQYGRDYQFRGIFFVAHCPKMFPANVVIEPRQEDGGPEYQYQTGNEEFDNFFQVRLLSKDSDDSIKSVLTDELVANLLEFNNLFINEIRVSVVENKFYVAISHDKELFEPRLFSSNKSFDFMQIQFNDLFYPIELINVITKTLKN